MKTRGPQIDGGPLDLDRYATPIDLETVAGRRRLEQRSRRDSYFVKLPLKLLALPIHRPITQLMAFLYLEAAFTRSPAVKASYQRAQRLAGLSCSRKTFYRAIDELEAVGVLTKTHVNGRAIQVMLHDFKVDTKVEGA
jgi:hypothetical protein